MLPDPPYNENELLLKIAASNEKAFAAFIAVHWKNIYGLALAWLKSVQDAEELAQDVFVKCWKNRHQLTELNSVNNYLFIIARNTMISKIRTRLQDPGFLDSQEVEDNYWRPDRLTENKEYYQILLEGISLLPPKRQQVFRMSRLEGLSYPEIAEQLGMNKDTVKQYVAMAIAFLKAHMKERTKDQIALILLFAEYF